MIMRRNINKLLIAGMLASFPAYMIGKDIIEKKHHIKATEKLAKNRRLFAPDIDKNAGCLKLTGTGDKPATVENTFRINVHPNNITIKCSLLFDKSANPNERMLCEGDVVHFGRVDSVVYNDDTEKFIFQVKDVHASKNKSEKRVLKAVICDSPEKRIEAELVARALDIRFLNFGLPAEPEFSK